MDLDEYQKQACDTDKTNRHRIMALLGLAGEVGSIFTLFKKRQRNAKFRVKVDDRERLIEELGDSLWYLSTVAHQEDISLSEIAETNLEKVKILFGDFDPTEMPDLELTNLSEERFPRSFVIEFRIEDPGPNEKTLMYLGDEALGDPLRSNVYDDDDYKFHDVFHLANVAFLGWSPVLRKLMSRKRVSRADYDEVEDGGRAQVVEEAVVALMFEEAEGLDSFKNPQVIPFSLLKTIRRMVRHFQVSQCSMMQWRLTMYHGMQVFQKLQENNGGFVRVDMNKPALDFSSDGKAFAEDRT